MYARRIRYVQSGIRNHVEDILSARQVRICPDIARTARTVRLRMHARSKNVNKKKNRNKDSMEMEISFKDVGGGWKGGEHFTALRNSIA